MVKKTTLQDAIEIVKDIEAFYDPDHQGYITYEDFKRYIRRHKGMDRSTVYNYKALLESFNLLKEDEYGAGLLYLTYKTSVDYMRYIESQGKTNIKPLSAFTQEDPKNEPKREA